MITKDLQPTMGGAFTNAGTEVISTKIGWDSREHREPLMSEIEPAVQLNEGFSEPGAADPPWAEVARVLSASEMVWLSTVRHDGQPHVTPLPAIWTDGGMYFCVGSHEQK